MPPFLRRLCTTNEGTLVVGQAPNGPALVATMLSVLSLIPLGPFRLWIARAAAIAWIYWSGLEIFSGVNTFRRILGGAVLLFVLLGLFRLR